MPLRGRGGFCLANCRSPGRPHVAARLVQEGLCRSLDEAFERFLKKGRPAWVPKFKMSAADAIELIHQAGGPGGAGASGVEPHRRYHSRAWSRRAGRHRVFSHQALRRQCPNIIWKWLPGSSLLVTGGSDCHGLQQGQAAALAGVKLPDEYVEKLKAPPGKGPRRALAMKPRATPPWTLRVSRSRITFHRRFHRCSTSHTALIPTLIHGSVRQIQSRPAKNPQQAGPRNQTHRHPSPKLSGRAGRIGGRADRRRPGHGHDRPDSRRGQKILRNPGRRRLGRLCHRRARGREQPGRRNGRPNCARRRTGSTVVSIVGVNGTGKTTTAAKLAHLVQARGETALLARLRHFPRRRHRAAQALGPTAQGRGHRRRLRRRSRFGRARRRGRRPGARSPVICLLTPPAACTPSTTSCRNCRSCIASWASNCRARLTRCCWCWMPPPA